MMREGYYDILDASRTVDVAAIKKTYRKLAKEYHPDSNVGNVQAEKRFKELGETYGILGGEKQRKLYDQYGHAAFDETAGACGGTESNGFRGGPHYAYGDISNGYRERHFEGGEDMDNILKHIFGGSGAFHRGTANGFRGNGFNKTYSRHGFPGKGVDIQSSIGVSFGEAAFGCKKVIHLQDENEQVQSMEVTAPTGIADGKVMRSKGKGMDGTNGRGPRNLPLNITARDEPGFRKDSQNACTTATIPLTTAVLGGEVKISTIYGDVICKVKAGAQSGSQIRLKDKGIVASGNPAVHDGQYVMIEVQVPKDLIPGAKRKLKEFEQLCDEAGKSTHGGYAA